MYGVDLDAPPSITPEETVVIPEVCVEDEQGYLEKLQHWSSSDFDEDYTIGCYMDVIQALNSNCSNYTKYVRVKGHIVHLINFKKMNVKFCYLEIINYNVHGNYTCWT